jgi:RNA polymerase sigma factor (sigma-70 family)
VQRESVIVYHRAKYRFLQDDSPGERGSPEEVEARAWLAAHARDIEGASLPSDHRRNETGETVSPAPSGWLSAVGWTTSEGGREHRPVKSLHAFDGDVELWQHLQNHAGTEWVPVVGQGGRTSEELDTRVRLDRAIARLREDQQALLRMRFFEDCTQEDIAEELNVRLFAVQKKLANAIQDLYVSIAETWNLPYDPAEEHLGIRVREGRPTRDREGERRAALLAFAAPREVSEDE